MRKRLQVGLGDLGRRCVEDLESTGRGHVHAAVDADESLAGRALAELIPGCSSRQHVRSELPGPRELAGCDAAIVMTRSQLPACADTFRSLLVAGLPVVSTCEELVHPWLRHATLARELDALARTHGARLLGTGVNPGFLMDALPGFLASACTELRSVRVERTIDASRRRPAFQRKIGAGRSVEDMRRLVDRGEAGHVGLLESLHLLAELCGLPLDRHEEGAEILVAEAELPSAAGRIARGGAAGVRQVARGFHGDALVAELVFCAGLEVNEPRDRILFDGEPPLEVVLPGGLHGDAATCAVTLSALQAVLTAPAGLHSMGRIALARSLHSPHA